MACFGLLAMIIPLSVSMALQLAWYFWHEKASANRGQRQSTRHYAIIGGILETIAGIGISILVLSKCEPA